jgi:hypothetical protein
LKFHSFLESEFRFFYKNLTKFRRIPSKVRFILIPYIWPGIAAILNVVSSHSRKVAPYDKEHTKVVVLRSKLRASEIPGQDLTSSMRAWIKDTLNLRICAEVNSSQDFQHDHVNSILAIDYLWIFAVHEKPFMFLKIVRLGIRARRLGMPVWIFLGDTFAVRYLPATCFLVAFCGGSIILQPNTPSEAEAFGLIFPSGPYLWTINKGNIESFSSSIEIINRPKVVLLARSGEPRRINYMNTLENKLRKIGWEISSSDGELTWEQYVNQSKNVKATATTNWMHGIHIRGTKKTREKISKTTTTHRVWEGFASGSMVMAQRTQVLDHFGFLPGTHYFELWSEEELDGEISFPSDMDIEAIAAAGQKLFFKLVNYA